MEFGGLEKGKKKNAHPVLVKNGEDGAIKKPRQARGLAVAIY